MTNPGDSLPPSHESAQKGQPGESLPPKPGDSSCPKRRDGVPPVRRVLDSIHEVRGEVRNSLYEIRASLVDLGIKIKNERRIVRNALLASVLGGGAMLALATQREWFVAFRTPAPRPSTAPVASAPPPRVPKHNALALTDTEKAKGYWECILPDRGPGIYAPMRTITMGHIVIPKTGAHTDDFGYDVIVHFHGFPSIKKELSHSARGVVVAGFDLGNGTGAYKEAISPLVFGHIKDSITQALRSHSGDDRAHIRHLALSAWSAGFAAVNHILRTSGDEGIDGVILLDGFHTAYVGPDENDLSSLDAQGISPLIAYAERAKKGERFFYFSHSQIQTEGYASTTKVARLLAQKLSLEPIATDKGDDPLGLVDYVDENGFHMRGFAGKDEKAHCDHVRNITEAVRDYLEPMWGTPAAGDAAASASMAPSALPPASAEGQAAATAQ